MRFRNIEFVTGENFVRKSGAEGEAVSVKGDKIGVDGCISTICCSRHIMGSAVPSTLDRHLRHAQKIIRRSYPPSRHLRSVGSSITRFSKSSDRLGPAKDLLNSLSYPLTDRVTLMPRGAAVNSRTALALGVGGDMGNDLAPAQEINKAVGVVVLVRSQRLESHSLTSLPFDHLFSRFPLCGASGLSDFQIDQQPIAVLHQRMRPVTQLSLFAWPLFGQKTLRS